VIDVAVAVASVVVEMVNVAVDLAVADVAKAVKTHTHPLLLPLNNEFERIEMTTSSSL